MAIKLSDDDKAWLNKNHPDLECSEASGILLGTLCFKRDFKGVVVDDCYALRIDLNNTGKSILPRVQETSGKIKKTASELFESLDNLHVNEDGSLCLCIPPKEKEYFPNGFNLVTFFDSILEPYLYWVSYYEKYGLSPWEGEAHGTMGYMELYSSSYIDIVELREYVSLQELSKWRKLKGHHSCPCKSGKILRKCHEFIYKAVYKLKNETYG